MLPDSMRWILAALAAFRLTWAMIVEDGPGDMWLNWRTRQGVYDYGEQTYPNGDPKPDSKSGEWWACKYCVSLWPISFVIMYLALFVKWPLTDALIAWLGLGGAVVMFIRWRPWREV
jgi:hypothetical protein